MLLFLSADTAFFHLFEMAGEMSLMLEEKDLQALRSSSASTAAALDAALGVWCACMRATVAELDADIGARGSAVFGFRVRACACMVL